MKKRKLLVILSIITVLSSCKYSSKSNSEKDVSNSIEIENEDMLGKWVQVTNKEKSNNSMLGDIIEFKLEKNSIAEIKVSDSTGEKSIIGKWSVGETETTKNITKNIKKVVGSSFEINSDIIIEYLANEEEMNIVTLAIELKDNMLFLNSQKSIFQKQ